MVFELPLHIINLIIPLFPGICKLFFTKRELPETDAVDTAAVCGDKEKCYGVFYVRLGLPLLKIE